MRFKRLFLTVLLIIPIAVSAQQPAAGPIAVINTLHDALLATMKEADALGIQGRYDRLSPILVAAYDFPRMAAIASGSSWADMSDADRSAVIGAFTHFSAASYASRFNGFSGEAFEVTGERDGPRGTRLVDTKIIRADGAPVPVTYVMSDRTGAWRIVDVLLDKSISELAVRRSEYTKVLANDGATGLVETLNEKADEMLGQAS